MNDVSAIALSPLDLSDLDRWAGVPFGGLQMKEPFAVNDIRRWTQGVGNSNPLHHDDVWAAESRYGGIVAPRSLVGWPEFMMPQRIPGTQAIHSADEFWFYGPPVRPGDRYVIERMATSHHVTETRFGPSVFLNGDRTFFNQHGQGIMKQRVTTLRYLVENVARLTDSGLFSPAEFHDMPTWSAEQLDAIEDVKLAYARGLRTHQPRHFDSVQPGSTLERNAFGPHTVPGFMWQSSAAYPSWGGMGVPDQALPVPPPWYSTDADLSAPELEKNLVHPLRTNGILHGAARGHVFVDYAQSIGMPRPYGFGWVTSAWAVDYLSNWAGEWGRLDHLTVRFQAPVLEGDVTYFDGVVTAVGPVVKGMGQVEVAFRMTNQDDLPVSKGTARVALPVHE